jgi:hypothetical protein
VLLGREGDQTDQTTSQMASLVSLSGSRQGLYTNEIILLQISRHKQKVVAGARALEDDES